MRQFAFIIFALLISASCAAQIEQPRSVLEIGFSGGINMNKMDFQPSIRQDFLKGINGGISVRYTSEKYFGMICAAQIEANFSQRGWKENFDDGTDNSYSRTLNYLEIPFLAHLSWGKETRGLQFFVNLGPQFGFFLSDSEKYKGNWNIEERPQSIRPVYGKSVENIFDYGITGGLGFTLAIVLFSSVRDRLEDCDCPKAFKGFPIALIAAGLLALSFMGFSGFKVF